MAASESFSDNIDRLLGLHRLTGREASRILGISTVAISEWRQGKRLPGLPALLSLSETFEVAGDRLVTATFSELLANELGDVDRFDRVEDKLARSRRKLVAVGSGRTDPLKTAFEDAHERLERSKRKSPEPVTPEQMDKAVDRAVEAQKRRQRTKPAPRTTRR